MGLRSYRGKVWMLLSLLGACVLFVPATSRAQMGMDKDPLGKVGMDNSPVEYGKGEGGAVFKPTKAEPYEGQIFCPVSGTKLGLHQPAVPVQTSIGEEKPTGLGKLFHKAKPGIVIYACCPACAEEIRKNPQLYLSQVITAKATLVFKYATAPDQIPAPPVIQKGDVHVAGLTQPAETPPTAPQP